MKIQRASLAFVLAAPALAQSVHVVDETGAVGDFVDIQSAVDASVTGDMVLVKTGAYGGFDVDGKGLVIAADAGQDVDVLGSIHVEGVPAAGELVLSGVAVDTQRAGAIDHALRIENCTGPVLVQDFEVRIGIASQVGHSPVYVSLCEVVTLVDARVDASGSELFVPWNLGAVFVNHTRTYLHDVEIVGWTPPGSALPGAGGHMGSAALTVRGSDVVVTGGSITGGDGPPASYLSLGPDGTDGGPAVLLTAGLVDPSVVVVDTTLTGGQPGEPEETGAPGEPGVELDVVDGTAQTLATPARRFHSDPVVRFFGPANLTFAGEPFDLVWLVVGATAGPALYLPDVTGAIHPAPPGFKLKFFGFLDAAGGKTVSIASLNPTGVLYTPVWLQALHYDPVEDAFVAANPAFTSILAPGVP